MNRVLATSRPQGDIDTVVWTSDTLPEPPPFWSRHVFGPSAVFTAVAIGSGELIFWPQLSLNNGPGVLWIAIFVILLQYVMNVEIGRYSLATGESVVIGAVRRWKPWAWILLGCTVIPWLWPGWARAGSQVLGGALGLPEKPLSIASLLLCGLLLAAPARVYTLVERLQTVLLAVIFAGVLGLCLLAMGNSGGAGAFWSGWIAGDGIRSILARAFQSENANFMALMAGIVFAGAGGILNLGYGLFLCEKGFGMGAFAEPVVGLRNSRGLRPADRSLRKLNDDPETSRSWGRWLSLSRREHALLFVVGNVFTILFIALMFYTLLGPGADGKGMSFLTSARGRFGEIGGGAAVALFTAVSFAIFFTSEIGIIDITSRIAAGILHTTLRPRRTSASPLYHAVVWTEIGVGIVLILTDPRQPYWFLVTSGILNTIVMAIYAALVAYLNRRTLTPVARPGLAPTAALCLAAVLYFSLFALTLTRL